MLITTAFKATKCIPCQDWNNCTWKQTKQVHVNHLTYLSYTYYQQSMDDLEQLKEQLAAVSLQGEESRQEVRTAEGRVEVLERQVPL